MAVNKNEKVRSLVLDHQQHRDGMSDYNMIQLMHFNEKDEALYAESYYDGEDPIVLELATSIEDIIKIRDWLNARISVVERRVYGLEAE